MYKESQRGITKYTQSQLKRRVVTLYKKLSSISVIFNKEQLFLIRNYTIQRLKRRVISLLQEAKQAFQLFSKQLYDSTTKEM